MSSRFAAHFALINSGRLARGNYRFPIVKQIAIKMGERERERKASEKLKKIIKTKKNNTRIT